MDIGRTDGVVGPGRLDGVQRVNKIAKAYGAAGPQRAADAVSISAEAGLISKALAIPDVRQDRIQEIRRLVESGQYETDTRLGGAIERFLVENPDISTD
jgi:anti-sigma28 factor (negative regulator of flagellin synthesis)